MMSVLLLARDELSSFVNQLSFEALSSGSSSRGMFIESICARIASRKRLVSSSEASTITA